MPACHAPTPARGSLSWVASARSRIPTIVPPCITAIRSLMPRISGSSDEIIRMASPRPASSLMSRWISALAPTSTPCVGSSRMQQGRFAASQRASATFCWFPPERLPTRVSQRRRLDPELTDKTGGDLPLPAKVEEAEPRDGGRASRAWCWRPSSCRG